jgi:hypothetical protein
MLLYVLLCRCACCDAMHVASSLLTHVLCSPCFESHTHILSHTSGFHFLLAISMWQDPQRRYFPGLTAGEQPGQRTKPSTEDLEALRDQFQPFVVPSWGCDPIKQPLFEGTVFRFPLRTAEQAKESKLRPRQACTTEVSCVVVYGRQS